MSTPCHESTLPAVLLIEDMAKLLGTSTRTIRKRMHSKTWPFTPLARVDRKPRWSRDAVLAIIAGQRHPTSFRQSA
jgi:hypothetical protein